MFREQKRRLSHLEEVRLADTQDGKELARPDRKSCTKYSWGTDGSMVGISRFSL